MGQQSKNSAWEDSVAPPWNSIRKQLESSSNNIPQYSSSADVHFTSEGKGPDEDGPDERYEEGEGIVPCRIPGAIVVFQRLPRYRSANPPIFTRAQVQQATLQPRLVDGEKVESQVPKAHSPSHRAARHTPHHPASSPRPEPPALYKTLSTS